MRLTNGIRTEDFAFEAYGWPFGNAGVSVMFFAPVTEMNLGLTGPVLGAVDEQVRAVAQMAAAGQQPAPAPPETP